MSISTDAYEDDIFENILPNNEFFIMDFDAEISELKLPNEENFNDINFDEEIAGLKLPSERKVEDDTGSKVSSSKCQDEDNGNLNSELLPPDIPNEDFADHDIINEVSSPHNDDQDIVLEDEDSVSREMAFAGKQTEEYIRSALKTAAPIQKYFWKVLPQINLDDWDETEELKTDQKPQKDLDNEICSSKNVPAIENRRKSQKKEKKSFRKLKARPKKKSSFLKKKKISDRIKTEISPETKKKCFLKNNPKRDSDDQEINTQPCTSSKFRSSTYNLRSDHSEDLAIDQKPLLPRYEIRSKSKEPDIADQRKASKGMTKLVFQKLKTRNLGTRAEPRTSILKKRNIPKRIKTETSPEQKRNCSLKNNQKGKPAGPEISIRPYQRSKFKLSTRLRNDHRSLNKQFSLPISRANRTEKVKKNKRISSKSTKQNKDLVKQVLKSRKILKSQKLKIQRNTNALKDETLTSSGHKIKVKRQLFASPPMVTKPSENKKRAFRNKISGKSAVRKKAQVCKISKFVSSKCLRKICHTKSPSRGFKFSARKYPKDKASVAPPKTVFKQVNIVCKSRVRKFCEMSKNSASQNCLNKPEKKVLPKPKKVKHEKNILPCSMKLRSSLKKPYMKLRNRVIFERKNSDIEMEIFFNL